MSKQLKDIIKFVIFIGIGIFFIYWSFHKLTPSEWQTFLDSFRQARWGVVGLTMLVAVLSHFFRALRWQLLFRPLGLHPTLWNTFGSVLVTYMANLAFPRLGEVARCGTMRTSENIPLEKSLGTVITERIIDVAAYFVILLLGLLVVFGTLKDWFYDAFEKKMSSVPSMLMMLGICVVVVVALIVLYHAFRERINRIPFVVKIRQYVHSFMDGLKSILYLGRRDTCLFVLYSLLIYICYIAGGFVLFFAFPETSHLSFLTAFVLYLFGSIGMAVSQGGIGAYPFLVQQALGIYAVPDSVGLAYGWMLWGSQQIVNIVLGMLFLVYFSLKKKKT